MTTYLDDFLDPIYQTNINDYYNGVLKLGRSDSYGTGSLLYDGRSVLTAAHVVQGFDNQNYTFEIYDGENTYNLTGFVKVHEQYDSKHKNNDIAIVTFNSPLISNYNRYELFRNSMDVYQEYTAVGYGKHGNGNEGIIESDEILKLKTTNTFDKDLYDYSIEYDIDLFWNAKEETKLVADFDNGYKENDPLTALNDTANLGTGITEGIAAPGDSGGPAFIENKIAGVVSYTLRFPSFDFTDELDSSFGEMEIYQDVTYYQEWIDKTLRSNYEDAPTQRQDVETTVTESNTYAYFLLEYINNRSSIDDVITLNYSTKDGSAKANEDYIPVSGTVVLYKDESSVVIPVEIIDDNIEEKQEFFYLDVSNPSYGDFGDDTISISAIRYINSDDIA